MTQEIMNDIAKMLGVSLDSLKAMPEEILGSMQTILENVEVKNDEDRKILYNDLNSYWVKGTIFTALVEVAKNTGIPYVTLKKLDFYTQESIVYEYMADSSNIERIYEIANKALAVTEIKKIAEFISVPESELEKLSDDIKEHICGMYSMEYEENGNNSALVSALKELVTE